MRGKEQKLVAYIERDENGVYVASVPSLPSCYTEGDSPEKAIANLREAAILCLRQNKDIAPSKFVGIQEFSIA